MLSERISIYQLLKDNKRQLFEYKYKTEKQYKSEFEFLSDVDSDALQQSRRNLSSAYTNFFNSLKGIRKGQKIGFPQFRKKSNFESYRTTNRKGSVRFDYQKKKLKLPILGWISYSDNRQYEGKILNATISKTPTGKFFASVLFEQELELEGIEITNNLKSIGLDMSLQNFYVDNLGNSPDYQKPYGSNEKKLAHYQKLFSKKQKGSKNREKARVKVAKVYEKIINSRKDFTHKLSTKLVKEYDLIVVENLSLKGMAQALHLGKSVMDLGYSEFVRQLEYKSLWNNKAFIRADKWFASSKTCSFCGYKKKDLQLQDRTWQCPNCKATHNRDQNAGQNLRNYGLENIGLKRPEFKSVEKKSSEYQSVKKDTQDFSMKQKALKSLVLR
jgi:putative transposase